MKSSRWKDKKGKRFSTVLLACLFMVSILNFPTFASDTEPDAKIVRVGNVNIVSDGEDEDSYNGYVYDYLLEISKYTGWKYEFVNASWEKSLEMLEQGEIDMLTQVQYTIDRDLHFRFSDYVMGTNCTLLLVSEDNHDIYYNDFDNFQGKTIGALKGTYQINLLRDLARKKNFTYKLVEYDYNEELWQDLKDGVIDMMLSESVQKNDGCKIVARFQPEPLYFMLNRNRTDLLKQLNNAMEIIQSTDTNYNGYLYDQYYAAFDQGNMAMTREEAEFVEQKPVLKLGYNSAWNPISYQDSETGEYKGITADLIQALEKETGFSFEYVPARDNNEAGDLLRSGEIDLIYGIAERFEMEAAQDGIYITKPYVEIPLSLAAYRNTDLGTIKKIAVPKNNRLLNHYVQDVYFKDYEVLSCKDTQACLDAVLEGKADAAYENAYILSQFGANQEYEDIETIYTVQMNANLCLGMRTEDALMASILNKAIAQLSTEDVNAIVIENTMAAPELRLDKVIRRYFIPAVLVIGAVVVIGLIISKNRISKYAFKDLLTGYSNENRFLLKAEKLIKSKRAKDFAVISLDIDHFKMVNNMCSFEVGNHILRETARIIHNGLADNEFFCRKADDRYLICMNREGKENLNDRLMVMLEQISQIPKKEKLDFFYSVSCGVCYLEEVEFDIHRAIGCASMARKQGKVEKEDSIVYYDAVMQEQAVGEQEIINRMEDALKNHEFCVFYQPQIRISDETIAGAEALARWIKPDGTMIYPDKFIPVFEKNGFITKLDLYIFEEVCRHIRKWMDEGSPVCRVSVNVSQVHLRKKDFHLQYLDIMKKYDIPSRYIELELTESTLFKNKEQMISLIYSLKNVGIKVAMDDFGSGYSSLNLMKDLPIDYLKLDREFFNTSLDSSRGQEVIKSISDMAGRLQICVVAEGVETRDQVDFLKVIHCGIVQGYFYYRPMPAAEFEKLKSA